jgi:FKBP-type peptidyl-prolyl cis-trans isomerase
MKSITQRLLLAGMLSVLLSAAAMPTTAQLAYLYGVSIGDQVRAQGATPSVDVPDVERGVGDALRGKIIGPDERSQLLDYMRASLAQAQLKSARAAAAIEAPSKPEGSYLFGLYAGGQLHIIGVTEGIDPGAVARGFEHGLRGKDVTAKQSRELQANTDASVQAMRTQNAKITDAFLARNADEPGVQTTASGLQYKVLATGDHNGPSVRATDRVLMRYRVRFLDGRVYESSGDGQPANYPVSVLVQGWQEAILRMKPGDKWELYVPPKLAFGAQLRPHIPPNSLLIYDVELVGIAPPSRVAAQRPAP